MRSLTFGAVSTALGLLAALVVAEGLLRAFDLAPTNGVATVTEAEFQSLPGLLRPNQALVDRRKPALPHRVHVNGLGYRGRELALDKAPQETRILMVGDSFTYGDFVSDDETLPAQLERELARLCPWVRVINAGIGGTTIDSHSRVVERALRLRPDIVILTFSENDLEDLSDTSAWDRLAANRRLKSRFPLSIAYPALTRLAVWHFALDAKAKLRAGVVASAAALDTASDAFKASQRAARMRHLPAYSQALTALRDRLHAQQIDLVLTLFPSHLSLREEGSTEQLTWLLGVGKDAGVTTVNLLPALRSSENTVERLYLLPHDGHPSAQAYSVAARYLAQELSRGGTARTSCGKNGAGS